jgi:hypothetical protein
MKDLTKFATQPHSWFLHNFKVEFLKAIKMWCPGKAVGICKNSKSSDGGRLRWVTYGLLMTMKVGSQDLRL